MAHWDKFRHERGSLRLTILVSAENDLWMLGPCPDAIVGLNHDAVLGVLFQMGDVKLQFPSFMMFNTKVLEFAEGRHF